MNKLESLRKTLIQTRKELNEVSNQKRRLLWEYRGHNLSKEDYEQKYQEIFQKERELATKVEELEFQLLLMTLKTELKTNRYISCYFRELAHPNEISIPQILTEQIKLPCDHTINIPKYISELKKADKTHARLWGSTLLGTITEIKHIDKGTRGVRELPITCPTCKSQFALVIELRAIPRKEPAMT